MDGIIHLHDSYAVIIHAIGQKIIADYNRWKFNPNEVVPSFLVGIMPREHGKPRFIFQYIAHQLGYLCILLLQFAKVSVEQVRLDGVCHHSTHEHLLPPGERMWLYFFRGQKINEGASIHPSHIPGPRIFVKLDTETQHPIPPPPLLSARSTRLPSIPLLYSYRIEMCDASRSPRCNRIWVGRRLFLGPLLSVQ